MEMARPDHEGPVKGDHIAKAQAIPIKFLENILSELKRGGLVATQRGAEGGYWLARPAEEITVADIIRAVEGPLAAVRGVQPQDTPGDGDNAVLQRMWVALRANLRAVLEHVTVADLAQGALAPTVDALADDDDAWERR
jgi:Rrf2 family protein